MLKLNLPHILWVLQVSILSKVKLSRYRQEGDKGERMYNSYFLTSALDGGEWSASRSCRALPPGKAPPYTLDKVCLRSEDAFIITCVANLMEVKVLYVQQDLRYEISSYWRFNV